MTIKRLTLTEANGETDVTQADAATDVRCRIEQEHGRMAPAQAGLAQTYDALGLFPRGTDIRPGADDVKPDEIVVTSPNELTRYRVLSVADEAGTGHHLTAKLLRVGIDSA